MNKNIEQLMLNAGFVAPELAGRAQLFSTFLVKDCIVRILKDVDSGIDTKEALLKVLLHYGIEKPELY